jgi:hypothetical protein
LAALNSNVPEIILFTVSNLVASTFPVYWLLVFHSLVGVITLPTVSITVGKVFR